VYKRQDLRVAQADTDCHAQNYMSTFTTGGEVSNPVQARLIKIESLEKRIQTLERFTQPVTKMIEDLSAPDVLEGSEYELLLKILKLMYFGKNSPFVIRDELCISKRTFSLKRKELVTMAMDYLML